MPDYALTELSKAVRELLLSRRKLVARVHDEYGPLNALEDAAIKHGIVEPPVVAS